MQGTGFEPRPPQKTKQQAVSVAWENAMENKHATNIVRGESSQCYSAWKEGMRYSATLNAILLNGLFHIPK